MMTTSGLSAAAVGLGATVFMDIWALLVNRAFGIVPANYCLVGRWFCHMPRGVFAHASIANASKRPFECAVGWVAHYVIGAFYGVVFVAIVSADWLIRPTFVAAVLFGIVSVIVPFLIMQPSLGMGIAAAKTPNPTQARLKSLMAHTVFGVGLYVSALGSSRVHAALS